LGLISTGRACLDGTRIPGAASQWRRYLKEAEDADSADGLTEPPRPKRRAKPSTDPDCRRLKTRKGFIDGYNAQVLTDSDSGLALFADVSSQNNDSVLMAPVLQGYADRHGELPPELAMDAGDDSPGTADALDGCGVDGLVASSDRRFDLSLNEAGDIVCPHGRALCRSKRFDRGKGPCHRLYVHCPECGGERTISGPVGTDLALWVKQRLRSRTPEAKDAAVDRSKTSELVFAFMKQGHGLRRLLLRGLQGASIEVHLSLVLHNFQVLHRKLGTEGLKRLLGARICALFRRILRLRPVIRELRALRWAQQAA
jgi:hypothetical protein